MRLAKEVLLEIVARVQDGILNGKDISENLRQIDLEIGIEELVLSSEYKRNNPRATVWPEDTGAN